MKQLFKFEEILEYLKGKNIKFNYIGEIDAVKYLRRNANYYSLKAYENNFQKFYIDGVIIDEYVDLDFAYLIDLFYIDYELRLILFEMIMNIEYCLKLKILNKPEDKGVNDSELVDEFLDDDFQNGRRVHDSIIHKIGSVYYKKIFAKKVIEKYKKLENISLHEFLEIITFGELVRFYELYTKKYNLKKEMEDVYILMDIVKIEECGMS